MSEPVYIPLRLAVYALRPDALFEPYMMQEALVGCQLGELVIVGAASQEAAVVEAANAASSMRALMDAFGLQRELASRFAVDNLPDVWFHYGTFDALAIFPTSEGTTHEEATAAICNILGSPIHGIEPARRTFLYPTVSRALICRVGYGGLPYTANARCVTQLSNGWCIEPMRDPRRAVPANLSRVTFAEFYNTANEAYKATKAGRDVKGGNAPNQ